ncbi:MAG: hypothetical protein WCT20_05055 [Candidatus Babeliales bacterium]
MKKIMMIVLVVLLVANITGLFEIKAAARRTGNMTNAGTLITTKPQQGNSRDLVKPPVSWQEWVRMPESGMDEFKDDPANSEANIEVVRELIKKEVPADELAKMTESGRDYELGLARKAMADFAKAKLQGKEYRIVEGGLTEEPCILVYERKQGESSKIERYGFYPWSGSFANLQRNPFGYRRLEPPSEAEVGKGIFGRGSPARDLFKEGLAKEIERGEGGNVRASVILDDQGKPQKALIHSTEGEEDTVKAFDLDGAGMPKKNEQSKTTGSSLLSRFLWPSKESEAPEKHEQSIAINLKPGLLEKEYWRPSKETREAQALVARVNKEKAKAELEKLSLQEKKQWAKQLEAHGKVLKADIDEFAAKHPHISKAVVGIILAGLLALIVNQTIVSMEEPTEQKRS